MFHCTCTVFTGELPLLLASYILSSSDFTLLLDIVIQVPFSDMFVSALRTVAVAAAVVIIVVIIPPPSRSVLM